MLEQLKIVSIDENIRHSEKMDQDYFLVKTEETFDEGLNEFTPSQMKAIWNTKLIPKMKAAIKKHGFFTYNNPVY